MYCGMKLRSEIVRKSVHTFGCVAAYVAYQLPTWAVVLVSSGVIALYCLSEALRLRGRSIPLMTFVTRHCVRQRESKSPALGPIYLAFGFMLCFVLFDARAAAAAIVIACVVDSAAGLIGTVAGKHPLPFSPSKTIEGLSGGIIAGILVALLLVPPAQAVAVGIAAGIAESLPLGDADNIVLPVASAWLLTWLMGQP